MLRESNIDDLNFIFELIMNEAKHGHFSEMYLTVSRAATGLKTDLEAVLINSRRYHGAHAECLIFENDGYSVGFVIMLKGKEQFKKELWMAAIDEPFRRKGFGEKMISSFIDKFSDGNIAISARCSPKSKVMHNLLSKLNFYEFATTVDGYICMKQKL